MIKNSLIEYRRQRGLSVVELMIALLIGAFMLAGIASVYISNKSSYVAREAVSALQENGRTALGQLRAGIEQAGFPAIDEGQLPLVLTGATASADNAPVAGSDRITVAFRASTGGTNLGSSLTDCLGNDTSVVINNTFFVRDGQLVCNATSAAGDDVIAAGVDNLQILYGLDTDNDNIVNRYVRATDLLGTSTNVVSVRVGLLLNSLQPVKDTARSDSFTVLDTQVTAPSDRLLRRVFTTTIPLRNRTLL